MARTSMQERIRRLESHLARENPVLADVVKRFQQLDKVARRLGLMDTEQSYAAGISWWPVISVLGTFSAGKSSFINQYVGQPLQRTGNQAVDDKFTVICYGDEAVPTVLPGLALDSDPRFPFYKISDAIERVAESDRRGVDSYLQLSTCRSDNLRGKILIDSPGFDADQQRTSTLLITDHIIGLSDLVLVFFDARHPETGAMTDTLQHLVGETVSRGDANKFLYILNQIDNAAREDNPEDVVAAWQRALAQYGLTAGRFYRIFNREAAIPDVPPDVRQRLERKRDEDLADIERRMRDVEVERAYRVVGALEEAARELRDDLVPRLSAARSNWRRRTVVLSTLALGLAATAVGLAGLRFDWWSEAGLAWIRARAPLELALGGAALVILLLYGYFTLRRWTGNWVVRKLARTADGDDADLSTALAGNVRAWWHPLGARRPRGWSRRSQRQVNRVLSDCDRFVQTLNDQYATPSGAGVRASGPDPAPARSGQDDGVQEPPEGPRTEGSSTF